MVFQDDPKSDELFYQYMFGDAFLVSAFTDDLYLPGGTWTNYWTGECLEGPVTIPATYPEDRGGPLFVRAGAIIPMASQDMAYWREKPMDSLTIDIFPGEREEAFTLYEDDGDTEQYKNGKIASTVFNQTITNGELTITVSPRQGQYDAMPAHREYRFKIHCSRPEQVHIDDGLFADWHHDVATSLLILPPIAAVAGNEVKIRLHFSSGITLLSLICGTRKRQINPF
jgi:alpha-glucosidase (family GH31 glycosyl hydrolase)